MTTHQWCTSSLRWKYSSIKGNSRFWTGEGVVAWCGERKEPTVIVLIAFWCTERSRTVYSARVQMAGGTRWKYQAASSATQTNLLITKVTVECRMGYNDGIIALLSPARLGAGRQLKAHDLGLSRLPPPGLAPNPQPKDLPGPAQLLTQ